MFPPSKTSYNELLSRHRDFGGHLPGHGILPDLDELAAAFAGYERQLWLVREDDIRDRQRTAARGVLDD